MAALVLNRKIMTSPSAFPSAVSQPVEAAKNPRGRKNGPTVRDHIVNAMSAEKNGLSYVALKKALAARGYDTKKNNSRVKVAVQGLVSNGTLLRTKGSGVSGSFKLNTKTKTRARQAVSKAKKHVGRTVSKVKKPARKVSAKKRQSSLKRVSRGKKSAAVRRASSQAKKPARVSSSSSAAAARRPSAKKPNKAKRPRSRSSTKRSHKASSRASRSSAKTSA